MEINPLISVITVVKNNTKTLEQTILSVLTQTYKNSEYIVIDGGSIDGTVDIIKKYSNKLTYWVSERDTGIFNAMNKGIDKCKGELVGIVNSDDWYEPNTVEIVVNRYIEERKKEGVYYGFVKKWKEGKEHTIGRFHHNFPNDHMIQHPTWFVSNSIYKKFGKFNDSFRTSGDFELFLRLIKNNVKFFPINAILSNFRMDGISTYGYRLVKKEFIEIKYRFGLITKKRYLMWKAHLWLKDKIL